MVERFYEYILYLNCLQLFSKLLSWRDRVRHPQLTAVYSMKEEIYFEVKACNLNPLIHRALQTLRA